MSSKHVIQRCHQVDANAWSSVKWAEAQPSCTLEQVLPSCWGNSHHKSGARLCTLRRTTPVFDGCAESVVAKAPTLSTWSRFRMTPERRPTTEIGSYAPDFGSWAFRAHKDGGRAPLCGLTGGAMPPPTISTGVLKIARAIFCWRLPHC